MATISSLLADHVTLQVRSVDRLFLQGYVPRLMTQGQVIRFLLDRGFPIPSPAVLGKIGRDYVNQINAFVAEHEIPVVKFVKGDVKEEIARKYFRPLSARPLRVVMVGIARRGPRRGVGGATVARTGIRISCIAASRSARTTTTSTSATATEAGVHQDDRVRAVPDLDLPQRQRVGQAAGRPTRDRLRVVG